MKIERHPYGGPMRIKQLARGEISVHSLSGDVEGRIREVRIGITDPEKKYHYTVILSGEDLLEIGERTAAFKQKLNSRR